MDRIRKFEPLWGVWKCEKVLGEGSFGRVYKAVRNDGPYTHYAAVKHISVPANEQQLMEVRTSGFYPTDREVKAYFSDIIMDVQREIDFMYTLKGNGNIVAYEDHMVIPKEDGIGCDIFIRMELLQGLNEIISGRIMTAEEAVKVGTDICTALEMCEKAKIIHRDIKPSNIFVNANGDYKLGDFGIARVLSGATTGVSKKGTYSYMAPEIYKCEPANFTSDIYSLGVVLYRLLNDNRLPFMPMTGLIRAQDQENAMMKMVSGAPMPPPKNADHYLAKVILKACAYNKKDRYKSAAEFRNALNEALNMEKRLQWEAPPKVQKTPAPFTAEKLQIERNARTQINRVEKNAIKRNERNQANRAASVPAERVQETKNPAGFAAPQKTGAFLWEKLELEKKIVAAFCVVAMFVVVLIGIIVATPSVPEGLDYLISEDNVVITGYNGTAKKLKIPSKIDGEKVTRIDVAAFFGCTSLEIIEIPNSVKSIGDYAFWECDGLTVTAPHKPSYYGYEDGGYKEWIVE